MEVGRGVRNPELLLGMQIDHCKCLVPAKSPSLSCVWGNYGVSDAQ